MKSDLSSAILDHILTELHLGSKFKYERRHWVSILGPNLTCYDEEDECVCSFFVNERCHRASLHMHSELVECLAGMYASEAAKYYQLESPSFPSDIIGDIDLLLSTYECLILANKDANVYLM